MSEGVSVKVAVRVRPFNKREIDMKAKCCIAMNGPETKIFHPETNKDKAFAFDFSYWSHDGYRVADDGELIGTNPKYATQRTVFEDIGQSVLDNAFNGYNSSLFAYGQTGSGKSFSMVGYGVNKGIIPICCDEMFKAIDKGKEDPNQSYQVTVTMLEIYNEQVRDLLNPKVNPPGGLKIRSKPGIGVYVEKLTPVAVKDYPDIEARMEQGTQNRTIGSTKMNATSSRAHTVFGILFANILNDPENNVSTETVSRSNLVDLAGSERANSTGASGDRLKEGCAINASLSALGNVISALADISMGKKKVFVPYRNSALTRLLQDALGGNSKTIMIAALSPASVNYEETLSTLRYADRAKKIKNKIVKMENPTDKIIRLLKEENARLMALLSGQGIDVGAAMAAAESKSSKLSADEKAELKREYEQANEEKLKKMMEENERMIADMKKSWEQKLADAKSLDGDSTGDSGAVGKAAGRRSNLPRILNLNEDPMLSEAVVYLFKDGVTKIGKKTATDQQDIILAGLSVLQEHALVHNTDGKVTLEALNNSKTYVNGDLVNGSVDLKQNDRVILGNNYVFRYENPEEDPREDERPPQDQAWDKAMDEYTTKNGMKMNTEDSLKALEKEEAKKREELEMKLKEMELQMRREREEAKSLMDQQKAMFMSGDIDEADLMSYEAAYNEKNKNLEADLAKRRQMSEQVIQEQMKRKRQTKVIEEQLSKLMPLVNEANLMADELQKPVHFEARLSVKSAGNSLSALDELKNMKTLEVNVRVSSTTSNNVWTWSAVKFDSRLYMMREMYQDYTEFGPREIPKKKDPFWDPPEAVEIGKAYVYLKALSQLVEIENLFSIVDYKGEEQGQLAVDIYPEGPNGEDLEYLGSSEELVGMDVTFCVRLPHAKGLPDKYSNDCYVAFTFNEHQDETEACDVKTQNPNFKYEKRFRFNPCTEELRQYLLNDAAVFEVKGFSDQSSAEIMEATADSPDATNQEATGADGAVLCEQCEENPASLVCVDCVKKFCGGCFTLMHKSKRKAGHKKKPLNEGESLVAQGNCFQCEENSSTIHCLECDRDLCDACNTLLHRSAKKASHTRTPLGAICPPVESAGSSVGGGTNPVCDQCEEETSAFKCMDCDKNLCDGCNALLHKSKKKAGHNRVAL